MILGYDYIILALIIIILLLPFYIYRKKVFKFYYNKNNIAYLIKDMQIYLKNSHPKINFDFSKIDLINKSNSKDLSILLIIEDIINQFINLPYIKRTQKSIANELLWGNYEKESIPKNSTANNLLRRKELVIKRDNYRCNRCGSPIKLDTSMLLLIKDIESGGTYHFENLTVLCNDCNKIIHSENPEKLMKDLNIFYMLKKKYLK
ncbi:HNH endonuclease [Arcobacter sp.]|uniref:HNH endonuclease n=1 Tax=Arcobacter sp. TaxID=1872629 RepID=UPI003D11FCC0